MRKLILALIIALLSWKLIAAMLRLKTQEPQKPAKIWSDIKPKEKKIEVVAEAIPGEYANGTESTSFISYVAPRCEVAVDKETGKAFIKCDER